MKFTRIHCALLSLFFAIPFDYVAALNYPSLYQEREENKRKVREQREIERRAQERQAQQQRARESNVCEIRARHMANALITTFQRTNNRMSLEEFIAIINSGIREDASHKDKINAETAIGCLLALARFKNSCASSLLIINSNMILAIPGLANQLNSQQSPC